MIGNASIKERGNIFKNVSKIAIVLKIVLGSCESKPKLLTLFLFCYLYYFVLHKALSEVVSKMAKCLVQTALTPEVHGLIPG